MALFTFTGLESHPLGTAGLNGIISGNWERLEAIFTPLGAVLPEGAIGWDSTGKVFTYRAPQDVLGYSGTVNIPFDGPLMKTLTLGGDIILTASNLVAGRRTSVLITSDATIRNFTFPAWVWIGSAAPTTIAASKIGILDLYSSGTTDGQVIAKWTVQP